MLHTGHAIDVHTGHVTYVDHRSPSCSVTEISLSYYVLTRGLLAPGINGFHFLRHLQNDSSKR